MAAHPYQERLKRCCQLMKEVDLSVLLLTKPSNMFEESPLPPGHAFFHGEKEPPPLETNVVIAVGNCGLYMGSWGVRVEDTVVVGPDGPLVLTHYPRNLSS